MTKTIARRLIILAALIVPAQAFAGVVFFSDMGPGFPADAPEGFAPDLPFDGVSFVANTTGVLTQIQVALHAENGNSQSGGWGWYADSGGEPGTLLESLMVPVTGGEVATVNSVVNPVLTAGDTYWFVLLNPAPTSLNWLGNDEGVPGGVWDGSTLTTITGDPTKAAAAIELTGNGTGVPEPSAAGMLAIGALALLVVKVSRRAYDKKAAPISRAARFAGRSRTTLEIRCALGFCQ